MAFRAPRFSFEHIFRTAGAGAMTASHAVDADFPLDNLIDDRNGTLFKFAASQTDPYVQVDLGAAPTAHTRIIIPRNHNIEEIVAFDDDNAGFSSPRTILTQTTTIDAGVQFDALLNLSLVQQFVRVQFIGTALFSLPQIVIAKILAPTVGPNLAEARDEFRANISRQRQPSGQSPTVQLGPQQRFIRYQYEPPITGADLTGIEEMIAAVGMSRPFYVDPASFSTPPELDEPVLAMKFDQMPDSRNSIVVPHTEARSKTFELDLIESLD